MNHTVNYFACSLSSTIELTIFVIGILYVVHFYFDVDNAVITMTMMVLSEWRSCAIQGVSMLPAVGHLWSPCSTCESECYTVIWRSFGTKSSWTGQWGKITYFLLNSYKKAVIGE